MLICLDVGNTHIFGGVFALPSLSQPSARSLHSSCRQPLSLLPLPPPLFTFRHETNPALTSDQFGTFLRQVLRENAISTNANNNGIDNSKITHIAIASVVPQIDYSLHAACKKYFSIEPFILNAAAAIKSGVTFCKTLNPAERGADLLAGAIAATHHYPQRDLIIIDLGTATTITAVSAAREFLGDAIIAGMRLGIRALSSNTAKLFAVEIVQPQHALGLSTKEALQAGLYYGHLGAIKELTTRIIAEAFPTSANARDNASNATDTPISKNTNASKQRQLQQQPQQSSLAPIVIGTGGFAHLFESSKIFDIILPNLVLDGIRLACLANSNQ
jgi:type III pantothenate kinase